MDVHLLDILGLLLEQARAGYSDSEDSVVSVGGDERGVGPCGVGAKEEK
jgi:hypothetical protein